MIVLKLEESDILSLLKVLDFLRIELGGASPYGSLSNYAAVDSGGNLLFSCRLCFWRLLESWL